MTSDLIGRVGTVSQSIRGGSPGEIAIKLASGFTEHLLAIAAMNIPVGECVLVLSRDPDTRILLVEPWNYPNS